MKRPKTLAETNPYIRDEKTRLKITRRQALDSSAFEGARGLEKDQGRLASSSRKADSKAPAKKSVSKE